MVCAIEVRGALEGWRRAASPSPTPDPAVLAALRQCVADGEAVLASGRLDEADVARWSEVNRRFHAAIVGGAAAASSATRSRATTTCRSPRPTRSRSSPRPEAEHRRLQFAQLQHRLIVDALARRESSRVEALMREHAYIGFSDSRLFGPEPPGLQSPLTGRVNPIAASRPIGQHPLRSHSACFSMNTSKRTFRRSPPRALALGLAAPAPQQRPIRSRSA